MILRYCRLPAAGVIGSYNDNRFILDSDHRDHPNYRQYGKLVKLGRNGKPTMPDKLRMLSPEAAADFMPIAGGVVVSDMTRSAQSSLDASNTPGRQARAPSTSGHNYAEALDAAVLATLELLGFTTGSKENKKSKLDAFMEAHNFYCHRRDHEDDKEWWHYNHLPPQFRDADGGISPKARSTDGYLQAMLRKKYDMTLTDAELQGALNQLGYPVGEEDGIWGRRCRAGASAFQRNWSLPITGQADEATERLAAFLTATIEWSDWPVA